MNATPPAATQASLFFGDARACKAWLNSLAMSNVAQTQATVLDALRVFNRAPFEPLERLKCLELLRDRVGFMVAEQRARQFSKPLPLGADAAAAWNEARSVLEEMETGYRRSLAQAELAEHFPLITQRLVRYIGAQMLLHALVYRRFDPALWSRLHQQYAAAEKAGIAQERVKDSLESEGAASSVAEAYAGVMLMQAAGLHEMTPPQVTFAEALVKLWARKVGIVEGLAVAQSASVFPLVVDLTRSQGADAAPRDSLGPTHRVIDVDGLARSIRRRIRALQSGEDYATLGLPPAPAAVDPLAALQRLARRWCEPASPEAALGAPGAQRAAGLVFGIPDIHFFLSGGKAFEQPDKERELSHQEKEDIAVFGRVTERTQSLMTSPAHAFSVDPWAVEGESLGTLRLRRRGAAGKGVAVGRLVGMRLGDTAPLQLGVVRALHDEEAGLAMTLALFPGRPLPVAVRSGNAPWTQAFRLPALEKLGVDTSLVVPAGLAFRGRALQEWQAGAHTCTVHEVLERGSDFERVTAL